MRILASVAVIALIGTPALAQQSGQQPASPPAKAIDSGKGAGSPGTASTKKFTKDPRLDLTSAQERTIYQSTANAKARAAPKNMPMTVGAMVPDSVQLTDLPSNVKQQVAAVKNYKYVKLQDGKLLLVDPTNRVVVGIITKTEGTRDAAKRG